MHADQDSASKHVRLPYVIRRSSVSRLGHLLHVREAVVRYAQIDAFFAQLESLYRVANAFAVSLSAAGSWLALYFDTPAQ